MGIQSSKFSFVRFNNDFEPECVNTDYVLPAYGTHEVAFQFKPQSNVDPGTEYTVSVTDASCANPVALDATVTRLNFKAIMILSQLGDFYLQTITYGVITNTYNEIVTIDEFLDILSSDFGFQAEVNEDGEIEFMTGCDELTFSMTATTEDAGAGDPVTATFTLYYGTGYVDLSGLALPGGTDCFRYQIDGTCSNLFKPITDACYTSLVTYSCKEPAFQFMYPDTPNKVRVPAYLTKPVWPKKREVYRRSSGRNEVLASSVDKIYPIVTDHMPEVFHECMSIMLSHDDIIIANDNIREGTVEVIESDDYAAEWIDDEATHNAQPYAKGTGKLKVAKYSYSNSNCGVDADPCAQEVPPGGDTCAPITVEFTLTVGDPGTYSVFLTSGPIPQGDALYVIISDTVDGVPHFTLNAQYLVCTDLAGCDTFLGLLPIPIEDGVCYAYSIERICHYTTTGVYAPAITGLVNCDLPPGGVSITSSQPLATIDNVTGIPGFTFDTGSPITAGESQTGPFSTFTGVISFTWSGGLLFGPANVTITKNGDVVDCFAITSTGTYSSASLSFLSTDNLGISFNGGSC